MKRNHSLGKRLTGAFVLLTFLMCVFFSVTGKLAVDISEKQLVNERLEKVTTQLIDQYHRHELLSTVEDNFYVNDEIPERFRHKRPGVHEVHVGSNEYTVCIRKIGNDTFAVIDDTSDFAITEHTIFTALGVGFIASLLLSAALGIFTARRIIGPLTALARSIERDDPPSKLPALELRNEIGSLARAFAGRTEQLQRFLADEKLFTGDVSHELRTPLTIMLGAAELLEVRLAQSPEDREVATRIRRVAAEASERVGALLLLSQSPDMLGGTQVSLTHLVEREVERYRQLFSDKPIQILFDVPHDEVWVHARVELAGIAIGNLLRNACQYTEQGIVHVQLTARQLTIEDNGPGVPENVRVRLFERFVRGHDARYAGSGLGLAIVKRVVDHLGWQIHHETPEKGGSRFVLHFSADRNTSQA
ncbi:MAG TPA: HAMP domain-containing sensor histidine kinase [Oxalicibacterium sp.]|uniref:sensor histidine kinase n=1 Tax=Oxalicibacterium sp. TaxID=2766525 RepID=UPI002CBA44BA|nr:HAMP domain-containing sensor histidine kinase [Oxalicibacterium sp.]HWU97975.1 HAMP domain-containing sensor histidine kinase [Oxalicibacterium sp.]